MTMELALAPLHSLHRKAAVDAGFDLEPEIDGSWWRLRGSGTDCVVWLKPGANGTSAWLALPQPEQLSVAREVKRGPRSKLDVTKVIDLPSGAAGVLPMLSAEVLHDALRRVFAHRAHSFERLAARWEARVAAALGRTGGQIGDGPAVTGASLDGVTEMVTAVRRRVGQDLFREALLDLWDGRCAVTELAVPELLRASHAKPWAVATDSERLDRYNGLLLAVHLDALFDQGFLTFGEDGQGRWSAALPLSAVERLGLSAVPPTLRRVDAAHQKYLTWHREHVFRP